VSGGDPSGVRARFLAAINTVSAEQPARLCQACIAALPVQRAAVVVHVDDVRMEILCASDAVAERVEWHQITLGEGPGWDAAHGTGPVLATDLATDTRRWPTFAAAAVSAGVGAMYALPLQVGAIRIGVLDLYCDPAAPLGTGAFADAVAVAELVSAILLTVGSGGRISGSLGPWWDQSLSTRAVHQATGMIMVQLDVPARDAYARLQAFAFADDRLISEVAADVVARQLHFGRDSP
jgi:hypothetical protein